MSAKEKFAEANEAFVAENYSKAIELYSQAIEEDASRDDFYVSRAHAHIKTGNYQDALSDSCKALEINPQNSKAYLRNGVAQCNLKDWTKALDALKKGQDLDAADNNFNSWIKKCEAEVKDNQDKATETSTNSQQPVSAPQPPPEASSIQPVDPAPMPSGAKTRYDWYQTETHVIVNVMVKNVKKDELTTDIRERHLEVVIKLSSGSEYSLIIELLHETVPSQAVVKILGSKVEIKLKKAEGIRWTKLEGEEPEKVKQFNPAGSTDPPPAVAKYPTSSHYTRDWDKLVTEIKAEEKDEKPEGDAAVNQLFQQIYADASDETRRAMNKSYAESGGTVLSTNWSEIGKKQTEVKPPDGMEYKKYEY